MDFPFSEEEVVVDEGLGYPKAHTKLCRNRSLGPHNHGPPFTSTPYILQQHEALSARELDNISPIIDPKAKPTTKPKIRVNSSNLSRMEGFSFDRPPFFSGNDYSYWKTRMIWFLKAIDYDIWDVVENGPHIPTKIENEVVIPKPKQEWDELDKKNVQLNARAIHYLYCAIDRNEYNLICQCESAKDIWRLLEIIHEGNSKVKESKINVLMRDYELFFMKDGESIVEMFTRFTNIINELQALGKVFKESEKVMKIMRSLPMKWETKLMVIQEVKDLTRLPLEELIGSLMAHEITMKSHQKVEDKKKRNIVLKASFIDKEEEEASEEDEDLALIIRKFKKFIKFEKNRGNVEK